MKNKKVLGIGLIALALIITIAAIIISMPKKKKASQNKQVVTTVAKAKKQSAKKTEEKRFDFIRFFDAEKSTDSEVCYKEFEKEMIGYMSKEQISKITPLDIEEIDYVEDEETKTVKQLVVPVSGDTILNDFSVKFKDQTGAEHLCHYSVYDREYTFTKNTGEETAGNGVEDTDDDDDPRQRINVIFQDQAEAQIAKAGLKKEDIIKAARDCVNEEGFLGIVTTVWINEVTEDTQDNGYYMTGVMDNNAATAIEILYHNGQYTAGVIDE